jgi:hypothetical protein
LITTQSKEEAKRRELIISEYGNYIEHNPPVGDIRDISELPFPKEEILDAIVLEIVRENNDVRVESMKACAFMLSDFQENVGPTSLTIFGLSGDEMLSIFSMFTSVKKDEGLLGDMIYRLKEAASDSAKEKYDSFRKLADEELEYIKCKLMAAEELRRQMPEEKKRRILT